MIRPVSSNAMAALTRTTTTGRLGSSAKLAVRSSAPSMMASRSQLHSAALTTLANNNSSSRRAVNSPATVQSFTAAAPFHSPRLTTPSLVASFNNFPSQQPLYRTLHTTTSVSAANPQSTKPASDSWKHMGQNIKEETAGIRNSIESAIGGGKAEGDPVKEGAEEEGEDAHHGGSLLSDAKSITGEMTRRMPRPALLWGAAGVLPYVGTAGASIYLARQVGLVSSGQDATMDLETAQALLLHAQNIQVAYGAIILSFLGAIHWGFEWAKLGGRVGNYRYLMGVAPLAFAWPTLLLSPQIALLTQFAGYVTAWAIDLQATNAGWAPRWYSTYRFWLSAAVGLSIIATLSGSQYFDASGDSAHGARGTASKTQSRARANAADEAAAVARGEQGTTIRSEKVGGEVQTASSDDAFVKFKNPKKEEEKRKEEERERQEEEEKKKKEEEKKEKEEKENKDKKEGDGDGEGEEKKKKDEGKDDKKDEGKDENKDDKKDEGKDEKKDEGKDGGDDKKEDK